MLTASCTVLREFLYALAELACALPRHLLSLMMRKKHLQHFSQLAKLDALDPVQLSDSPRPIYSIFIAVGDQSGQAHASKLIR